MIRAVLDMRGKPIGALEMLIATQAVSQGAILVKNNGRYFRRDPRKQLASSQDGVVTYQYDQNMMTVVLEMQLL
jgi:hypothetical protein